MLGGLTGLVGTWQDHRATSNTGCNDERKKISQRLQLKWAENNDRDQHRNRNSPYASLKLSTEHVRNNPSRTMPDRIRNSFKFASLSKTYLAFKISSIHVRRKQNNTSTLAGFSQFQGMWLFTVNLNDKVKQIMYAPTRYVIGFLSKLYNMFFIKWRAESWPSSSRPLIPFSL